MNTMNETSLTREVDPVSVFIGRTLDTSMGSASHDGLEKGVAPMACNPDYNSPPAENPTAAEESTVPLVASGEDRPMELCAWCGFMMHYGRGPVSHGICPPCREVFFPEVPYA